MRAWVSESRDFLRDTNGGSMAEYALLVGVITVAHVTGVGLRKNQIANLFNTTTSTQGNAGS